MGLHNGTPLPPSVRDRMEGFFGANLATVRIHAGPGPERLGALAVTAGEDICVAPGGHERDLEILGHELTHVVRQRAAAPGAGGTAYVVDPALEAEAHRLGHEAACWCPGLPVAGLAVPFSGRRGRVPAMAQPWIKMAKGTGDDPARYGQPDYRPLLRFDGYFAPESQRGKPIEEKFELLTDYAGTKAKVDTALRFLYPAAGGLDAGLDELLRRWLGVVDRSRTDVKIIGDVLDPLDRDVSGQFANRKQAQVPAELKYFFGYGELAWALLGESAIGVERGDDSLVAEQEVAGVLLRNPHLGNQLAALAFQAAAALEPQRKNESVMARPTAYGPLHGATTNGDLLAALRPGGLSDPASLVAKLHDVKDLCLALGLIPGGEQSFDLRLDGGKVLHIAKMDMRYNLGTPDEADPWVLWMREHRRAVWAGPSYTMVHMWTMARFVGASPEAMASLAWAMFAYWSVVYPHTSTPVHRFHETFAAAQKFGVPYAPDATVRQNLDKFLPTIMAKL